MSETAVERRLREMAALRSKVAVIQHGASWLPTYERTTSAIDAGREAIALLRLLIPGVAIGEVCLSEYCQCGTLRTVHEAQALLARCEGEK